MLQKFKNMLLITNLLVGSLGVKKPSKMNFPPKKIRGKQKIRREQTRNVGHND